MIRTFRSVAGRVFHALEGVGIALDAIRANKVRAALTISGVAVGVFVVVAMSAVVHGINSSVRKDFEAVGPYSFFVYRRPVQLATICDGTDETCPWRRNPSISMREADAIAELSSIQTVTAHVSWGVTARYKDRQVAGISLDAYTPNWTEVDGGDIDPGRSFTRDEAANAARVVIINDHLAERLFGEGNALDKVISLNGQDFSVIGVYHYTSSFLGRPGSSGGNDPKVIVPLESARRHLKVWMGRIDLTVKPRDGVPQAEAMDDVTATIRSLRGLKPRQQNNFALVTQERLLEVYNGFFGVLFMVMLSLSAVGLLVGGVGVVAIMMISVTERTREIGVRKALGATKSIILWQFLVEAATLTGIGAGIGLLVGSLVAFVIDSSTSVPASTPPSAVAAALLASAATGIVFGMLPAVRAARLDPVEALRHE